MSEVGDVRDVGATEAPVQDAQRVHVFFETRPQANARATDEDDAARCRRALGVRGFERNDLALEEPGITGRLTHPPEESADASHSQHDE